MEQPENYNNNFAITKELISSAHELVIIVHIYDNKTFSITKSEASKSQVTVYYKQQLLSSISDCHKPKQLKFYSPCLRLKRLPEGWDALPRCRWGRPEQLRQFLSPDWISRTRGRSKFETTNWGSRSCSGPGRRDPSGTHTFVGRGLDC